MISEWLIKIGWILQSFLKKKVLEFNIPQSPLPCAVSDWSWNECLWCLCKVPLKISISNWYSDYYSHNEKYVAIKKCIVLKASLLRYFNNISILPSDTSFCSWENDIWSNLLSISRSTIFNCVFFSLFSVSLNCTFSNAFMSSRSKQKIKRDKVFKSGPSKILKTAHSL